LKDPEFPVDHNRRDQRDSVRKSAQGTGSPAQLSARELSSAHSFSFKPRELANEPIFRRKTPYALLNQLFKRLLARKQELSRVLDRPEIPLHTNASENDIRACAAKRKVSGGTVGENARTARDAMLGLVKTCRKLKISFFEVFGDRLASTVQISPTAPP